MSIASRHIRNFGKIHSLVAADGTEWMASYNEFIEHRSALDFALRELESPASGNLSGPGAAPAPDAALVAPVLAPEAVPLPPEPSLQVASTLSAGQVAIIGYNTGQNLSAPATVDKLHFVLMDPVGSGTQIFITDRAWTPTPGSTAIGAGTFGAAAGDGTLTWTAAADLAAGTVVSARIESGNVIFTVNGVDTAPVSAGGFDIDHSSGDAIYIYQGAINAPTRFLTAGEFADGNTTFNGSLVNTGLTVASGTAIAIGHDAGAYAGPSTHAGSFLFNGAGVTLLQSIGDQTNWTGDDVDGVNANEQFVQTGPWFVHHDVDFYGVGNPGGSGIFNVVSDSTHSGGIDTFNYSLIYNNALVGGVTPLLFHPNDIVFDTVNGKYFIADSDITGGHNRILQGNISDLSANPGTVPTLTVLYNDPGVTTDSRIDNLVVDKANQIVYFTDGTTLVKVNYNTANQAGTVLFDADSVGNPAGTTNNFFSDIEINFATGHVYMLSERATISLGGDNPSKNHLYDLSGLTTGSGAGFFSFAGGNAVHLPFNPDDNDAGPSPAPGEAFPEEDGLLAGIALDTTNNILYFSTGRLLFDHDGNSGTPPTLTIGGIFSYALTGNPNGNYTQIYEPLDDGNDGSDAISEANGPQGLLDDLEINTVTGKWYVVDFTGDTNGGVQNPGDEGIWSGNLAGGGINFIADINTPNQYTLQGFTINNAPTLTGNGLAAAVTEASSAPLSGETTKPLLFNTIAIADPDTTTADEITGAVIRISSNFLSDAMGLGEHQDYLRINNNLSGTIAGSGINYTYSIATGAMVLTGAATVAEYKAAIELVTFSTDGDNITNYGAATTRQVAVSVSDGLTLSNETLSSVITVTGINDAPVNTPGAAMAFNEDTTGNVGAEGIPPTPVSNAVTGISVFDVDANPATQDITVTLSVGVGTLSIRTNVVGGIVAGDITGGANGSSTITITATQNEINTTLAAMSPAFTGPPAVAAAPNGLIYTPPANYNGATNLTITTNDNGFNGNDPGNSGTGTSEQDQDVKVINIADVNDAPTVGDGTESAADILEDTPMQQAGSPPPPIAPTVATLFGGQFADAVDIQVTGGNPTGSTGDTFAGIAIVSATSNANGAWQYWDGDSWENMTGGTQGAATTFTATTQIRFNPTLNYNGPAPTLTVHLIESGGPAITNNGNVNLSPAVTATGGTTVYSSGTVVLSQNIIAVNDAPVNTVGGTLTVAEDAGATNVTGMSISDVDANPATDVFTVTLDVLHGTLNVSTGVPGGVGLGNVANNGTATVTLTGTINQINATLAAAGGLTYTPTAQYNGSDRVQITTNDGGATGQDPGLTGTATSEQDQDSKTINVTAVNDPVTGAAPASATMDEDATNVAISGMSISDIDATLAPAGVYVVTLTSTNGTMTLTTLTGLTFSAGGGTADATMTFRGTLADINNALATASYTPTGNYNGSATITLQVTDTFGGIVATGTGAATNDSDVVNVTVTAVNDPISTSAPPTATVNEDAVNAAITGLSISDVDAALAPAGVYEVTLSATHGLLTLTTITGLTFSTGSGTGDATMTFHGTLADINTALATAKYSPDAHYNGSAQITLNATDIFGGTVATGTGSATSDSDIVAVTVTAVNDTPVVAVATSVGSTEQVAGTIDAAATITDIELGALDNYAGSTLTVGRNGGAAAEDLISFGPSGGAFTVNGGNLEAPGGLVFATFTGGNGAALVITFTSTATPATQALVNAVVQSLQYTYTGDNPPASIVLDYSFNDGAPANAGQGGGGSPIGVDSITVNITDTPENVAPTLDLDADNSTAAGTGYAGSYTEGGAAAAIADTDVLITDSDVGDDIVSATITIVSPVAGDKLNVGTLPATISIDPSSTDTMVLLVAAPGTNAADFEAAIEAITFSSTSDDPGASRTINVEVSDGTSSSAVAVSTITITQLNDGPTLTATGGTPTFTEGGAAVDLFSAVSASTIEAGQTITSMTLTVTNVTESNSEVLTIDGSDVALGNGNAVVTAGNGLTVNVSVVAGVATVSFTGAALSAAALAAIVDAITYRNLSDNPTDADRVITITQIVDSGADGGGDVNNSNPNVSATVNVNPVNDPANITGDATGDVTEDGGVSNGTAGTPTDSGDLDATDLDNFPDDTWQAVAPGGTTTNGYGTYELSASGVWTYTLDNSNATVQALNGAATLTDTFTALTADGTAQIVTVTIHAQNDAAVITGDATGDVTEAGGANNGNAGTPTDTGDLDATDVDNTADAWQAVSAGAASANGYGTYELSAAGVWTYTVDNNNNLVQLLNGSGTLTDSFTAFTADGTAQVVTVTIHAQNDYPTIGNLDGDTVNYVENAAPVALDLGGDAFAGDVDSSDFDGGTLQVNISANYNAAQDVLGITTSATITLSNGINAGSIVSVGGTAIGTISAGSPGSQSFTITLNANSNATNLSTLIQALNYSNSSDNPTTLGGRTIQVSLTDGDGSPATTVSTLVTLTRINDEPTSSNVTINGVSEDDPYTFQTSDFAFSDVDGHAPFTVKFTSLPADGDILLNGVAILMNDEIAYSAIAGGMLTFQPDLDEFGSPYTSFTFQVRDNGGVVNPGDDDLSATYTATINVTPDNLAPEVDLNGAGAGLDAAVSYTEDAPGVSIGSGITVSDPNEVTGDLIESATITLTDAVAGDALTVSGALPGGITAVTTNPAGQIVVTLSGPASTADYAAAIAQVLYSTSNQDPTFGGTDATRTITVTVNDGMLNSAVATSTVTITPLDDAAVAQPDAFATDEATVLSDSVFPDNGSGADNDVDGPPLAVGAVNGSATDVDDQIMLASGALLTLRADGTFDYDPNGAFDTLPGPVSGASNLTDTDSFTYTLVNGNEVTVTITISGVDSDGDILLGTPGVDSLDGGIGADHMTGFAGDDTYFVDNVGDTVVEVAGEGSDTIRTSVSYTLAAGLSIETLTTTSQAGTTAIDLTGNEINNRIEGNDGANALIGNGGLDLLYGHGGDDALTGGAANDLLDGGAGIDTAFFAGSIGLSDTLVGWVASSSEGSDVLQNVEIAVEGSGQRNLLVGSTGFASIQAASDAALAGDNIRLAQGSYGGTVTYDVTGLRVFAQTGAVQNVVYAPAGSEGISVYGANLADTITTGAGADTLSGGGGADHLSGGAGNDIYHVSEAGDVVTEGASGGSDIIYSQVSYTLNDGSEVEALATFSFEGTGSINLTGNGLNNYLIGNDGNNQLDGKIGADVMVGRAGHDVYLVDNAGDAVFENSGGGYDVIYSSVSFALTNDQEIEGLSTITWELTDGIDLTGNAADNYLIGNAGSNVLDGKGGNDVLQAREGADTFAFTSLLGPNNVDVLFDFAGADDTIRLAREVFTQLAPGATLAESAFVVGTAATTADHRIIYDGATGQLFYDSDGTGSEAAILFAVLNGAPLLAHSDFTVI